MKARAFPTGGRLHRIAVCVALFFCLQLAMPLVLQAAQMPQDEDPLPQMEVQQQCEQEDELLEEPEEAQTEPEEAQAAEAVREPAIGQEEPDEKDTGEEEQAEASLLGEEPITTAAGLYEAFEQMEEGGEYEILLGAGIHLDGGALTLPGNTAVTLRSDETGPHTLYQANGRHFMLEGIQNSSLSVQEVVLQGDGAGAGGIALYNCANVQLQGLLLYQCVAQQGGALLLQGSADILLQDISIQECLAQSNGGGLYAANSTLVLHNGVLQGNTAASGGGIYLGEGASLQLSGVVDILYNTASPAAGGGTGGGIAAASTAQLTFGGQTRLQGNQAGGGASQGYGGALYIGQGNTGVAFGGETTFEGNYAGVGGAVYLSANASLEIGAADESVDFCNNRAGVGGGAVCAYENASLALQGGVSLYQNSAETGGALYMYQRQDLWVGPGVSFYENLAHQGYQLEDSNEIAQHERLVQTTSVTAPYTYLYNNHDVNYQAARSAPAKQPEEVGTPDPAEQRDTQQAPEADQPSIAAPVNSLYGIPNGLMLRANTVLAPAPTPTVPQALQQDTAATNTPQGVSPPRQQVGVSRIEELQSQPQLQQSSWAVINVAILLLGLLLSTLLLMGLAAPPRQVAGKSLFAAMCKQDKTGCTFALTGIFAGVLNLLVFLLASNAAGMRLLADAWTLPMAALLALQVTMALLLRVGDSAAGIPGYVWHR